MSNRKARRKWDLDVVRDRCKDDGGCWVWQQYVIPNTGLPQANINGRATMVRRFVMDFVGRLEPDLPVMDKCGNRRCCNPAHLFMGSYSEALKRAFASGRGPNKGTQARRESAIRLGFATLDMNKAREIRRKVTEGLSIKQLAQEFGVHRGTIRAVVQNRSWVEVASNASVFTWRPAA